MLNLRDVKIFPIGISPERALATSPPGLTSVRTRGAIATKRPMSAVDAEALSTSHAEIAFQ